MLYQVQPIFWNLQNCIIGIKIELYLVFIVLKLFKVEISHHDQLECDVCISYFKSFYSKAKKHASIILLKTLELKMKSN